MFEARFKESGTFKKVIDAIKDLVKNVNIDASEEGLSLQAMDASHVALVSLNLIADGFDAFRCNNPYTLGLQIENMAKILKIAGTDDFLTLEVAGPEPSVLRCVFESKHSLGIPETQYQAIVKLPSSEFTRICRELSALSETVKIETTKEAIKFSVTGDAGAGSITLKNSDDSKKDDMITLDIDEPTNLSFALRYLNLFNKAQPLTAEVTLAMSKGTPLMVEYSMPNLGSLKFYLAPKISEEEG